MEITGYSVFTGKPLSITIKEGIVSQVTSLPSQADHKALPLIAPGFFDIQVNGYVGKDYSTALKIKDIEQLISHIAKGGVTQHIPTIITNSEENILKNIKAIVNAKEASNMIRNALPAIHIEGPFISPREGARGVHNPSYIRSANIDEFIRWQEAARGSIKIVTLSPEDDQALEFIKYVSKLGVIVAIGHTDVSPGQIEKAIDAGATLSTHLGNGSPSMIPRLENFIYKQLSDDRMNISIIADGFHLPSFVLDCFTRCKGKEKTILVSDVASLAGSTPGRYTWNGMDIEVHDDGHMGLYGTSNLAGASLLLDSCVANLVKCSSFTLEESVRCATVNPRTLTGISTWDNQPKVGDPANFTIFTYDAGLIRIKKTILQEHILFDNELAYK